MDDPFEKVASGLNRDLAWIAGGVAALAGAVVMAGVFTVETVIRRLRHARAERPGRGRFLTPG